MGFDASGDRMCGACKSAVLVEINFVVRISQGVTSACHLSEAIQRPSPTDDGVMRAVPCRAGEEGGSAGAQ